MTTAGVTGNTAANVAGAAITVLDANSFILNGVAGNGAPHAMPRRARGGSIGRGLPVNAYIARVALAPDPAPGRPSSKIFVSMDRSLFRSTNGGITFVPMNNFTDFISALHAPDDPRPSLTPRAAAWTRPPPPVREALKGPLELGCRQGRPCWRQPRAGR